MDIFSDPEVPLWYKILNLDDSKFEKSEYADPNGSRSKFRLKDLSVMRKLAPHLYEAAAEDIKEHNEMVAAHGNRVKKYKLGKKIGSIPLIDAALHPELTHDVKAQKRYWEQNPQLKAK